MRQQGQLFRQQTTGTTRAPRWGYRYRIGGRGSRRVQRGGFTTEHDAAEALDRDLERLRRELRLSPVTLAELVDGTSPSMTCNR